MNSSLLYSVYAGMVLCLFFSSADAHEIPISEIKIVPGDAQVHLEMRMNAVDLKFISEIDQNGNGTVEKEEFEANREAIGRRMLESLEMEIDGVVSDVKTSGIMWEAGGHHLIFRAHYPAENPAAPIKLTSNLKAVTSQTHISWVTYVGAGENQLARLDSQSNVALFNQSGASMTGGIFGAFSPWVLVTLAGIGLITGGVLYSFRRSFFSQVSKSTS